MLARCSVQVDVHLIAGSDTLTSIMTQSASSMGQTWCCKYSCRRRDDEPLLTFSPSVAAVLPHAVQQTLLTAMQQVELIKTTRLYPMVLEVLPDDAFRQHDSQDHTSKLLAGEA